MLKTRIIPCLLLKNTGLIKTVRFKNPKYLGDPLNIVRIFNDKEVDEIVLLDTTATIENRPPLFESISKIAGECFMPLCYGGGVRSLDDIKTLFNLGIEKVAVNSFAVEDPLFITKASEMFGNQSIVVSIDVKKNPLGKYKVFTHGGKKPAGLSPVEFAMEMEKNGAGELLLTSIDLDGTMEGYDLKLIESVSSAVSIPVIACGGAGSIQHLKDAITVGKASAAAAGSLFVFHGPHRAVLINYPDTEISSNELQHVN